jgi:ketosteroid isomerase-like protein
MTRDTIQSIDQQWNKAYQTNDHAALAHILADDWTAIDARGKRVTKAAILDQVTHVPWPFTNAQFQTISCWQGNDVAIVTGRRVPVKVLRRLQDAAVHNVRARLVNDAKGDWRQGDRVA